ncbi:MAG: RluA family pseudouridine synthase [Alphaproteobacteria bacterium]|nr:RluA family pseudouridine synthase [Alphaproteobacteria bacterium]
MNTQNFFQNSTKEDIRLDKLVAKLSGISRTRATLLIKKGEVLVGNIVYTDPSKIISSESIIEICNIEANHTDTSVTPKEMDINIIYEDNDLIVINKQAGLTVHPGAGNYQDTLVNGLLYKYHEELSSVNDETRPGIVHRLDRETSGLMVVAKNNQSHLSLSTQIANRDAKRKYMCITWGIPKIHTSSVKTQIGRSHKDRTKMTVLNFGGKEAITHYRTQEIYANGLFSLVEATLDTGRTHQIRVHMSHIGCSIVGDKVYGANQRKLKSLQNQFLRTNIEQIDRQALHAYYLSFSHPVTQEFMEFTTELPEDMEKLVKFLQSY